jgi:hypothetical protein
MACDPGTCFNYAHTNFVILGEVLRKASGKPIEELIRDGIVTPLGLDDTRSEATAVIREPVLHAFSAERGIYEDSTYWNPSWTLARGAIMTTNIHDLLTSAIAIGTGSLVSPEAYKSMIAPLTARFPPWDDNVYYGLGVNVTNSWVVQTPSFAGFAGAMAYLPSKEIGIAVVTTLGSHGPTEGIPPDTFVREDRDIPSSGPGPRAVRSLPARPDPMMPLAQPAESQPGRSSRRVPRLRSRQKRCPRIVCSPRSVRAGDLAALKRLLGDPPDSPNRRLRGMLHLLGQRSKVAAARVTERLAALAREACPRRSPRHHRRG